MFCVAFKNSARWYYTIGIIRSSIPDKISSLTDALAEFRPDRHNSQRRIAGWGLVETWSIRSWRGRAKTRREIHELESGRRRRSGRVWISQDSCGKRFADSPSTNASETGSAGSSILRARFDPRVPTPPPTKGLRSWRDPVVSRPSDAGARILHPLLGNPHDGGEPPTTSESRLHHSLSRISDRSLKRWRQKWRYYFKGIW